MEYQKTQKIKELMETDPLAYMKLRAKTQQQLEKEKNYIKKVKNKRKWK
jgi:hypothetical protein